MRKSILRALGGILTCTIALTCMASCGKSSKYKLLWADEFEGEKLDESIWKRELRDPGWTNNELQRYTDSESNGFMRDGKFVIKGIEDENGNYSSCKLRAQDSKAFKYGKIEARAKVPEGKGLWPAIWMMPKDESYYGQWPKCGEIDIMEVLGHDTKKAYGTVHYGEPHAEKQGTVTLTEGTFASDYHTYTVEWNPDSIEWFIDGTSYLKVNDWFSKAEGEDEKAFPAPFNQDFCIQINLAIGGDWPGNPEKGASYMSNAEFEIDYVRVYQKSSYNENVKKPEKQYRKADKKTGNYITNNDFSKPFIKDYTSEVGWMFYTDKGGKASYEVNDGVIKIKTTNNGEADYAVQLLHSQMPFEYGKKYTISFEAWADSPRTINEVCIDAPQVGWSRYWKKQVDLTTERKKYEYTFTMNLKSDDAARLEFNLGNTTSLATVYITNVVVKEAK